jgi:hypothetical protein
MHSDGHVKNAISRNKVTASVKHPNPLCHIGLRIFWPDEYICHSCWPLSNERKILEEYTHHIDIARVRLTRAHPLHAVPSTALPNSRCYWPCRNPCLFDVELATQKSRCFCQSNQWKSGSPKKTVKLYPFLCIHITHSAWLRWLHPRIIGW